MKKLFLFSFFLLFFALAFSFLGLDSHALTLRDPDYDLPTDPIIIEYYSKGGSLYGTSGVSSSQVCRYEYTVTLNSAYNRQGMGVFKGRRWSGDQLQQLIIFNQYDLFNSIGYTPENGAFGYWTENEYIGSSTEVISTHSGTLVNGGSNAGYGSPLNVFDMYPYKVKQGVLFEDENSARDYLDYGITDGIVSGADDIINSQPVIWGPGGNPFQPGSSPDTEIPIPQVQIVNENAYGTHKIRILNNEFDDRLQADGTYGVVCRVLWYTCDGFSMSLDNPLSSKYKIYYDNFIYCDHNSDVYPIPTKNGEVNLCPRYIDFDENPVSKTNYSSLLADNPLANRNITVPSSKPGFRSTFEEYLAPSSCPYNSCVFELYFLKKDSDGYMHYGPKYTGHFDTPSQGTVVDFYFMSLDPADPPSGSVDLPPGGGQVTPDPNPTVPSINPDVPNVDATQLTNGMKGIFSLVGDFPDFMRVMFAFFPSWIFDFLVVAIGIMVAIGLVKFFLG